MKRLLYFSVAALFAVLVVSCVKDKGNYDYTDPNSVKFDVDNTVFARTVPGGSEVTFTPVFTTSANESDDSWSYEWYETVGEKYTLVSTEKSLTVFADGGGHSYVFRMKNNRTGVWYRCDKAFSLSSASVRNVGFLVLTKRGSDIGVEMVAKPVDQYQEYYTLYKSDELIKNEGIAEADRFPTEGRTGLSIQAVNNVNATIEPSFPYASIWVLTDKGASRLTGDYKNGGNIRNAFYDFSEYKTEGDMVPTKFISSFVNNAQGGGAEAIFIPTAGEKGNWFWAATMPQSYIGMGFANPVNILPAGYPTPTPGSELSVGKHAALIRTGTSNSPMSAAAMMVMWSEEQGQFLVKTGSYTPAKCYTSLWLVDGAGNGTTTLAVGGSVAFNAVEPGRKMVAMGTYNTASIWAVVNDGGTYKLLDFEASSGTALYKKAMQTFNANTRVGEPGTKFFYGGLQSQTAFLPYFYYVTSDNKVMAAPVSGLGAEEDVTNQFNPDGDEIVAFKSMYPIMQGSGEFGYDRVIVVTKKAGLPEDSCCTLSLYQFKGTAAGADLLTYKSLPWDPTLNGGLGGTKPDEDRETLPMRFTGLGDVVDVTYRGY